MPADPHKFHIKKAKGRITALFEFSEAGKLMGIFLNSQNDEDQTILEKGLSDLLRPQKFNLLKRLFRSNR